MKIFISGSISIDKLDNVIISEIEEIILNNYTVLIGDANGVDLEIQKFLSKSSYENVVVYFTGNKCRNNISSWPEIYVENKDNLVGRDMYSLKDIKMAKDADQGLMIWDGESIGTKNNILRMNKLNKKIKVYFQNIFYSNENLTQIINSQ